jgi:hypothetical protein
MKAKLKTKETKGSAAAFLATLKDEQKRKDSLVILEMLGKASGDKAKMWGSAIVGFGNVLLKYDSGRELDWFKVGFSPRKEALTLYGLLSKGGDLLPKLGKCKTGKGCLYIKKLEDVDLRVLKSMMDKACR